jgi:hypothetical protein
MPMRLSIDDFKSTLAICEVRYEEAYLLYDRTGKIGDTLRKDFSDFKVVNAAPHQTTFKCKEGSFVLELKSCRFATKMAGGKLDSFGRNCKLFFDCVTANLETKVFTRIGLRVMFRKDFKAVEDAKKELNSLSLTTVDSIARFGVAEPPVEVLLRWEDAQIGTTLRLKAETSKFDVELPAEIEPETPEIHKSFHGLNLDVDFYTVAPVEVSQWDASSWISHSIRTIRRDTDQIFGN